jgi:hypothetical protein
MRNRVLLPAAALLLTVVAAGVFWWRASAPPPATPQPAGASLKPTAGLPWFVDVTTASGIDFRHFDSATPLHYLPEVMGSGVAWIDYNNDGWPDLFCVQAGPIFPDKHTGPLPTAKLYRNNGDGTFTDVTAAVGLDRPGFGQGCAVGDFDNDGFDDLVVTYLDHVVLYHNQPDGRGGRRFVDVTARAGIKNTDWGTSCGWGDVDGDGRLDLYICNYVKIDLQNYKTCFNETVKQYYACPPTVFPTVTHRLYRNNGDGTFTDISERSGVAAAPAAPGLGVLLADLDGDGRLDIYAANDMKPAYLFHNQGGGRFVEKALYNGCGLQSNGRFIAGMGVDAADVDGSGRPSLFVTNYQKEPNILFLNKGGLFFQEWSYPSGLGAPSINRLAFGTVFCDFDLDGAVDVAVANGHVVRNAREIFDEPFAQEAQLFTGDGRGKFRDVSAQAGGYFRERRVGRGLAWADFNNDGKPDLAYSHLAGPLALLRNDTETVNHWVRLELIGDGKKSNRNAIGARIDIEAGGRKQVRWLHGGGSYLSASERRQLVGLGTAARVERVTITWPSGRRQEFRDLESRRWWRFHEGAERPEQITPGPAAR